MGRDTHLVIHDDERDVRESPHVCGSFGSDALLEDLGVDRDEFAESGWLWATTTTPKRVRRLCAATPHVSARELLGRIDELVKKYPPDRFRWLLEIDG